MCLSTLAGKLQLYLPQSSTSAPLYGETVSTSWIWCGFEIAHFDKGDYNKKIMKFFLQGSALGCTSLHDLPDTHSTLPTHSSWDLSATNHLPAEQHLPRERGHSPGTAKCLWHTTLQALGNATHPDSLVWDTKLQSVPSLSAQWKICAQGPQSSLFSTDRTELGNVGAGCGTVGSCCKVTQTILHAWPFT